MKDQRLYLSHILRAIEKIEAYAGTDRVAFDCDGKGQDAVLRNFEIIGEAAKRLTPATRQKAPEIPWRAVAGFRDVLIHDYDTVNLNEVWLAITRDVPALRKAVERLLQEQ